VHDAEWVFTIGPFFGDDGEADASPGGFRGVAAAGDGAGVEGIHDVLYAFLCLGCLCGFIVALC